MKRILQLITTLLLLVSFNQAFPQNNDIKWALVMSKGLSYDHQVWRTRSYFPKQEIAELWKKKYYINSLRYGDGKWSLVMSKGSDINYENQAWITDDKYPQKQIEEYWNKDFYITDLTYGDGVWMVIMSKGVKYTDQIWRTRADFPLEEIKKNWDKGYSITNLDYGNGSWGLVMSKVPGIGLQKWFYRDYFPQDEIKKGWDEGYYITNICHGTGKWAVVMTKNIGYTTQSWRTRTYFPEKEIAGLWDKGYYITGIFPGNYQYVEPTTYTKPTVTWNKPLNPSIEVNKSEYNLHACVKSESPLSEKKIYVNGTLQTSSRGFEVVPDDGCDHSIDTKIRLREGENIIKLMVTNKGGTTTAETRKVIYTKPVNTTVNHSQGKRLALIIGNSNYAKSPLRNPKNDAIAMSSALKNLGFEVIEVKDAGQNDMKRAIDNFGAKLKNYDVGLFFYAGHGLQVSGNNYLLPLGTSISTEQDVEYECVDAGRVLGKMEASGSKVNIVILDACRDNPFARSWSRSTKGNGLSSMDAPLGSIIAYATSPGKTASDGTGSNGLYTQELLKHIKTPGIKLEEVFKRVRIGVVQHSERQQTPWETSSLIGDFYFMK